MATKFAPEWQVTSLDGTEAPSLKDFRGKHTLLLFFNLGCLGCMSRALPLAGDIARGYPELHVAGIHTNFEGLPYSRDQIRSEIESVNVSFPIVIDQKHNTYDLFEASGTPHWILLNENGEIEKSIFGSQPNAQQRLTYSMIELFGE